MRLQVSRAFKRFTDDKTVSFASTVFERMSSNDQYAVLKPFIDDIKIKKDAFVTGIALAIRKDQDRKDEKAAFKVDLINHLDRMARKLEDLAEDKDNNSRVITDSGFELRTITKTEKVAIKEIEVPQNLVAANLKKAGSVLLTWDEVMYAINYAIRYKPKSETVWQNGIYNDKKTYTFNSLQSDTVYEFEVFAVGPNGLTSESATTVPVYVS